MKGIAGDRDTWKVVMDALFSTASQGIDGGFKEPHSMLMGRMCYQYEWQWNAAPPSKKKELWIITQKEKEK